MNKLSVSQLIQLSDLIADMKCGESPVLAEWLGVDKAVLTPDHLVEVYDPTLTVYNIVDLLKALGNWYGAVAWVLSQEMSHFSTERLNGTSALLGYPSGNASRVWSHGTTIIVCNPTQHYNIVQFLDSL